MRRIKFWGFRVQLFIILILGIWSYLIYGGMFYRIPDTDKFCVVRKYETIKSIRSNHFKQYRLICNNGLGAFDIESGYNLYSSTNIGDSIQFDEYLDAHRLFDYAVDKTTSDNVISSINNRLYRFFYNHIGLFLCTIAFYITLSFYEIINIMCNAVEAIRKLMDRFIEFD